MRDSGRNPYRFRPLEELQEVGRLVELVLRHTGEVVDGCLAEGPGGNRIWRSGPEIVDPIAWRPHVTVAAVDAWKQSEAREQ